MGVDLFSITVNQSISYNWTVWHFLLMTANNYGWVPEGTVLDFPFQFQAATKGKRRDDITKHKIRQKVERDCLEWGGDYTSNDCQLVSKTDSRNMIKALMRAMNDEDLASNLNEGQVCIMKQFADFLRNGAFRIG